MISRDMHTTEEVPPESAARYSGAAQPGGEVVVTPTRPDARDGLRAIRAALASLLVPPLIGIALIVMVAFDLGDSELTNSPGTASVGLVVGAILILGSAALFMWNPVYYEHYIAKMGDHIRGPTQDGRSE
jgi:hypothetical protein